MKSIFTFILLLVMTFSSAYSQAEQYMMTSTKLTVHSGPGLNFNTIGEIAQGTQVYVMSSNYGEWSAIQYKKINGFVVTKYLTEDSRIADAEAAAAKAAAQREAAKAAAAAAIAQAEAARRAAEEAARKAALEAKRARELAEAEAAAAIAQAEAAQTAKDEAARKARQDASETEAALKAARARAAKGIDDVASNPIESATPSYGASSNSSSPKAANIEVTREDKYSSWEKKTYKSGATPKSFNFKGKFDYKLDNYLKIKVGKNTEVVIKLYKLGKTPSDDQLVRVTYINTNTTQFIRNIPEGEYKLKIAYGREWKEKVIDGKKYGTFTKNALYEESKQILDFQTVKTTKGINVPSYNLSLDLLPSGSGGYSTGGSGDESISADKFNQ
ncbi:SH3 domain-containing protein [Aquimarina spongiae]|uniref:SH3b domain-containing protein n=1 Tax=Aquimarina spongiae TaxID=570521 RepID=A0A1M6H995_9FLAO|nr:SH3 domain-containing protein [Aquimarina spongiae]SHJ18798.1 hypothetical protein SAMN04488508_106150 [Aquimarina spongiae]